MDSGERGMNPVAKTITDPRKEYWPSQGLIDWMVYAAFNSISVTAIVHIIHAFLGFTSTRLGSEGGDRTSDLLFSSLQCYQLSYGARRMY